MNGILDFTVGAIQVTCINIVLSVDNAIMLALSCQGLPKKQQRRGIVLGTLGAVALRVIFTLIVARLLYVPYLKLGGGLFVVYLAAKLPNPAEESRTVDVKRTLTSAVWSIIVADAVISLDNAIALGVAAQGSQSLIVFGLLLSAPLMMFGAHLIGSIMERLPILIWAGAVILGWAGGELIAGDPAWERLGLSSPSDHWTGAICGALVLGIAASVKCFEKAQAKRQTSER